MCYRQTPITEFQEMNVLRETKKDRVKQTRLLDVFSSKLDCAYGQFKSTSNKYRIDGYLYDDDKNIKAWVECKWYNKKAHLFINPPKFIELTNLSEKTKLPSYFLFREGDFWGYILIHDGNEIVCNYTVRLCGGTPQGREVNDDDVEPLIVLAHDDIIWGNKT